MILQSHDVAETERLGEQLGMRLQSGDFVGLIGELGAGKTAFVRGTARGAGIPEGALVSSPTFTLVNAYRGGRLAIDHVDLYRIRDAEELYDSGFYDLPSDGGALLVEWIDRVPAAVPEDWLEIRLRRIEGGREIRLIPHGPRSEALAQTVAGFS